MFPHLPASLNAPELPRWEMNPQNHHFIHHFIITRESGAVVFAQAWCWGSIGCCRQHPNILGLCCSPGAEHKSYGNAMSPPKKTQPLNALEQGQWEGSTPQGMMYPKSHWCGDTGAPLAGRGRTNVTGRGPMPSERLLLCLFCVFFTHQRSLKPPSSGQLWLFNEEPLPPAPLPPHRGFTGLGSKTPREAPLVFTFPS